jgi:hypothetical protein
MSCVLTNGYTLGCRDNIGGVQEVYIGEYNADALTYSFTASNVIDAFGVATVSFYTFEHEIETGSYTENGVFSTENGTSFYEETLSITLHRLDATLRNQILLLAQNRDLRIVFIDNNDVTYIMGLTRGAVMSAGTAATGTAVADLNGYTLTFQSQEPQSAGILEDTLANTVTGITIVNA